MSTASPTAVVPAEPPRSRPAREPSAMEVSTAASIQPPARDRSSSSRRPASEHQRRGQDRRQRIRRACPGDVRGRSVRAWKRPFHSPTSPDGAGPRPPIVAAPRSERMSPNMFSATITSKREGRCTRCSAPRRRTLSRLDLGVCGGHVGDDLAEEGVEARTFALSTHRTRRRRPARRPLRELERSARCASCRCA